MTRTDAIQIYRGATLILALARLTDGQRHAVIAHAYRGLTLEQTGLEAGRSRQWAHFMFAHGINRLRQTLADGRAALTEIAS